MALLAAVTIAAPSAEQGRATAAAQSTSVATAAGPIDAVMRRMSTTNAGTYFVNGAALEPVPEASQIATLLQADVLRGPERASRVAVVVGAQAPQDVEVRLRIVAPGAAADAPRVVADAAGTAASGPMRMVREFTLAPGDYELQAVVSHSRSGGGMVAAIAKSRLNVPDVRGGALTITPIVIGEAAAAARRSDSQPFLFGRTALTPAVTTRIPQDGTVGVAFRVFNWDRDPNDKPDLTVEYLFYEQGTKGLHLFNKIKPQQLTADTLGASFDAADGSVTAGTSFPLGSFTFGAFQLKVRVTDNRTKQTVERQLSFTVAP